MSNPKKNCSRPCRADECPSADNNAECGEKARYMCTSGSSAGGCSGILTQWQTSLDCDDCCDRWHPDSCNECDRMCTQEECTSAKINCPADVPWACVSGVAGGGCAPKQQMWSMGIRANNGQCNSCCDSRACNSDSVVEEYPRPAGSDIPYCSALPNDPVYRIKLGEGCDDQSFTTEELARIGCGAYSKNYTFGSKYNCKYGEKVKRTSDGDRYYCEDGPRCKDR